MAALLESMLRQELKKEDPRIDVKLLNDRLIIMMPKEAILDRLKKEMEVAVSRYGAYGVTIETHWEAGGIRVEIISREISRAMGVR